MRKLDYIRPVVAVAEYTFEVEQWTFKSGQTLDGIGTFGEERPIETRSDGQQFKPWAVLCDNGLWAPVVELLAMRQ